MKLGIHTVDEQPEIRKDSEAKDKKKIKKKKAKDDKKLSELIRVYELWFPIIYFIILIIRLFNVGIHEYARS